MAGHAAKRASRLIQERTNEFIKQQKGPRWKRELIPDHKWDYIDVEQFRKKSCYNGIRYLFVFLGIILSSLAYVADLWSAGILLIFDTWSLSEEPKIPFYISKWIFVACIILSFLLLAWDVYKCRSVIATRDISLGVTNVMAYRYYSIRDFSKFCLFRKINDSRKTSDMCAFFVFYTLKGWKKLLFAQGPRQIIAGVTLAAMLESAWTAKNGGFELNNDWDAYGKNWQQRVALISMSFTCALWCLSMLELIVAVVLYIPVFCQIQGNLKEYCCHKIDKRITEILEKQRRKRLRAEEKRLGRKGGGGGSVGSKNGSKNQDAEQYQDMYDENQSLRHGAAPFSQDQYIEVKAELPQQGYYNNGYPSPPGRTFQQQQQQQQPSSYYYPNDPQPGYFEMQSYTSPIPSSAHTAPTPTLTPQWTPGGGNSLATPNTYTSPSIPHTPMSAPHQQYSSPTIMSSAAAGSVASPRSPPRPYRND
ncbi:hypothetical protein INT45_013035, partial [Circinella minor]